LRNLLQAADDIEQVQAPSKDEPCYRLVGTDVPLEVAASTKKVPKGKGEVKGKGSKTMSPYDAPMTKGSKSSKVAPAWDAIAAYGYGKGKLGSKAAFMYAAKAEAAKAAFAKGWKSGVAMKASSGKGLEREGIKASSGEGLERKVLDLNTMDMDSIMEMATPVIEAAIELLEDEDSINGSRLNKLLQGQHPTLVVKIRALLGGKGWLKKLFEDDDRVVQVRVEGHDEPCYRLSSRSGTPTAQLGETGRKNQEARQAALAQVDDEDRQMLTDSVVACFKANPQQPKLTANEINKLLLEACPGLVRRVRAALGGKGWLRTILETDHRFGTEQGDEPLFLLN